jgi:hypothetical protein
MPTTPGVTLTANLQSILAGGALGGYLRVTLCGFGPVMPCVPGAGMLGDAAVPQMVGPQISSTPISQVLYGNDVIQPGSTFYEIAVLDQKKNVIQAGMYQFANAAGTVDLSTAGQIVPPYGFNLGGLITAPCTGAVPGNSYVSPGRIMGLFYNGILLPKDQSRPTYSYTATGTTATLNFLTQDGDRIDALCVV